LILSRAVSLKVHLRTSAESSAIKAFSRLSLAARPSFSGKILHYTYPNGDEVSNIDIVYLCRSYSGEITPQASEVSELRFFSASEMPPENELTPPNRPVLKRYIESLAEC
jgi:hypothetical protein